MVTRKSKRPAPPSKPKSSISDDEILNELGLDMEDNDEATYSHEDARVIAGFEEIVRFVDEHKRAPNHGEGNDIFERLYAVRLERVRSNAAFRALVLKLDSHGLLAGAEDTVLPEAMDDATLLEELGVTDGDAAITTLKHVRPRSEVRALEPPEDAATRKECTEFARFKPLFARMQKELDTGAREMKDARHRTTQNDVAQGEFFVVQGQVAYIASVGTKELRTKDARNDWRLRVVYDNGTETDVLMRSFQRALSQDPASRQIVDTSIGPLFGKLADSADIESGSIYVLRSNSKEPFIAQHRDLVHKIGVTGNELKIRTAAAEADPTFLFADVEVVAQYKLYNINRSKLENILHRVFSSVRLSVEVPDRFGNSYKPREWFLVPLEAIQQAVDHVAKGTITGVRYDAKTAMLVMM
jgi:T5orf172 domain